MLLSVVDRLILLNIIDGENDIPTLRVIRQMQKDLGFTEEELEILKFENKPNGGMVWQPGVDDKEIEIGHTPHNVVLKCFDKINQKQKMNMELLAVFEKFEEK